MDHQAFFDLVGVDPFDLDLEAGFFERRLRLRPTVSPAVEGTLALPGPALTVSTTFGFEQKKLRKAQSSEASSPAARHRVLLEHRVRRRFALDPLHLADLEAVLLQQRDRHVELVAGHVRHLGRRVAGQREADQDADQDRGARPAASGGAAARALPLRSRPSRRPRLAARHRPAAAARRRPCRRSPPPGSCSAASRAAMKASALWKRSPGSSPAPASRPRRAPVRPPG